MRKLVLDEAGGGRDSPGIEVGRSKRQQEVEILWKEHEANSFDFLEKEGLKT